MAENEISPPVQCSTCNRKRAKTRAELANWTCECPRCAQHSGRAKKTVRHCCRCQTPIVVVGVPAAVSLLCKACYEGDSELRSAESLSREARRNYDRLTAANQKVADLESEMAKHETEIQRAVKEATATLKAHNLEQQKRIEELTEQVDRSEEEDLAARLKTKMIAQYGVEDRDVLEDFAGWVINQERWGRTPAEIAAASDAAALVDEYLEALEAEL